MSFKKDDLVAIAQMIQSMQEYEDAKQITVKAWQNPNPNLRPYNIGQGAPAQQPYSGPKKYTEDERIIELETHVYELKQDLHATEKRLAEQEERIRLLEQLVIDDGS